MTAHTFDVAGMPAGYTVGRQSLADTEAILAVVHAYDMATLGYPDYASSDVVDVYNGAHTDPERDTWVVRDDSGTVCAWAFIASNYGDDKDDFDVYSTPGIDTGIRPALVDAIVARVSQRAVDRELSEVLATGYAVVGDDAWAAVLVDHGFKVSRRFSRMRIEFDGPRALPVAPPGVTIRVFDPASARDWSDWHGILVDSFSEHWGSAEMTLSAFRGRIDAEEDPNFAEWFFADVGSTPVGICQSTGSFNEQNAGWVRNLGVLSAYRGRGIARLLLEHAFASYTARGCTWAGLGVDTQNETGALRLYESVGLQPAFQADAYQRTIPAASS
jgi:mycothiol synthase